MTRKKKKKNRLVKMVAQNVDPVFHMMILITYLLKEMALFIRAL